MMEELKCIKQLSVPQCLWSKKDNFIWLVDCCVETMEEEDGAVNVYYS